MLPDGERKGVSSTPGERMRPTKPYPREREERGVRLKNPREEFEAARKRGLTEEEVRGIVKKFADLKIDSYTAVEAGEENYRSRRENQQEWYLELLSSGLDFSVAQKETAKAKLRILALEDFSACKDRFAGLEIFGRVPSLAERKILNYGAARSKLTGEALVIPAVWLRDEKYRPSNLCELTEAQNEIGWDNYTEEIDGFGMSVIHTKDYGTGRRYEFRDDFSSVYVWIARDAGRIFPLSMDQIDRMRTYEESFLQSPRADGDLSLVLGQVKYLSSQQLMTLLLFQPSVSETLMVDMGLQPVEPKR